uniref:Uncharacterized protein n=1 Tax=Manihot esculenta TaxID=3983 RepID=A0A2C9VYZ0_MANES
MSKLSTFVTLSIWPSPTFESYLMFGWQSSFYNTFLPCKPSLILGM